MLFTTQIGKQMDNNVAMPYDPTFTISQATLLAFPFPSPHLFTLPPLSSHYHSDVTIPKLKVPYPNQFSKTSAQVEWILKIFQQLKANIALLDIIE